jgi:hypothetical protein
VRAVGRGHVARANGVLTSEATDDSAVVPWSLLANALADRWPGQEHSSRRSQPPATVALHSCNHLLDKQAQSQQCLSWHGQRTRWLPLAVLLAALQQRAPLLCSMLQSLMLITHADCTTCCTTANLCLSCCYCLYCHCTALRAAPLAALARLPDSNCYDRCTQLAP